MVDPVDLSNLVARIDELYRPSLRGHWQRRVVNRLQTWLARLDLQLFWTEAEERAEPCADRVALPDRDRPPRWLCFTHPIDAATRERAELLAPHVARVATLMEGDAAGPDVPPRWRERLTARQTQVALLAANGLSNDEVADELGIAPRTVARQLQEVFRRLELSNRAALAAECALGRPPTPFLHTSED